MTISSSCKSTLAACALAAVGLVLTPADSVWAQSAEDIVKSLQAPKTRSLTRGVAPAGDAGQAKRRSLVNSLKGKATRAITVEERIDVANAVKDSKLPSIDIEVFFEYDSASIMPNSLPQLAALGEALSNDSLKSATFMVAGHTDAAGSADYNQGLSERRADAVKSFLMATYKFEPTKLIAIGYGKEQLKLPNDPLADENRRVQVVNLAVD